MTGPLTRLLSPGTKAPRSFTVAVVAVLAAAAWWYVHAAVKHGHKVNAAIDRDLETECRLLYKGDKQAMAAAGRPMHAYDLNDQRVYMNYAMGLREFHWDMFITRMRMPLYMWALACVADGTPRSDMTWEQLQVGYDAFFPVARAFNIGLSLVLLVALFFALRPWLGNWLGVAFVLIAAFQLFILKSPYVQPEVLQTAIITVTIAWVVRTLCETTWRNGLITGLLLCLWHMTKANALVALGLMGAVMGLKLLFTWRREGLAIIVTGLLTVVAYVLPMSPYLYNSWKLFGDPFYNVQSKYYMWAQDDKEKAWLQDLSLDRSFANVDADGDGRIDHPEKLPSAARYWKEHPGDYIVDRLQKGMRMMMIMVVESYAPLTLMQLLWACILVWAAARRWDDAVVGVQRGGWAMLYVAALLTVFVVLFGWFTPLKVGPRLLNSISLIPLFCCMAATRWLLRDDTVTVRGAVLSTEKLLALCFLALWLALTASTLPSDLADGYFAG